MLSRLKRLGTPMILYEIEEGKAKPFGFSTMQHKVQRMRVKLGLPSHFTFDACRHGGMTELEEAELTDGQAARCQRTGRSRATSVTPSAPRSACSRPPASGTHTGWRTKWRQTFRMSSRKPFRMKHRNKV